MLLPSSVGVKYGGRARSFMVRLNVTWSELNMFGDNAQLWAPTTECAWLFWPARDKVRTFSPSKVAGLS